MQKWLNDLHAIILKQGFDPEGGASGGGSGGGSGVLVGKYLGDTYTGSQKEAIANGTFEGLNIGDYWTINGINWRIADFDYYYNVGDTAFTKHHVIIVPDTILYETRMGSSQSERVYSSTELHQNIFRARNYFHDAFGATYIPSHRALYSNAITDGIPSNWAWRNMEVELMSEEQVYGHAVWGFGTQNGYDVGTQKTQFRLFSLDQSKINIRVNYWLTNVKSLGEFSYMDMNGNANFNTASSSLGVRPFACIVGDPEQ